MITRSTLAAAAGALTVLLSGTIAVGQRAGVERLESVAGTSSPVVAPSGAVPSVSTTFLGSFSPRAYTVDVLRWGIPVDGTDADLTTERLQAAIDWASEHGFGVVRIPKGTFLLGRRVLTNYVDGIRVPSDMDLQMARGTTLRMVPNDAWASCVVTVSGQRNVRIRGGAIQGDRYGHTYTPRASDGSTAHDEGHGICIRDQSSRVLVEQVAIRDATGDGILIHGGGTAGVNRDVVVRGNEIWGSRRQGISVVRAENLLIESNYIHDIRGIAPQFGIDFETPKGQSPTRNVLVAGNRFVDNAGGHIVNFDAKNLWIDTNTLSQHAGVSQTDGPIILHNHTDGVVRGNRITMTDKTVNGRVGILTYSDGVPVASGPSTTVSDNTCVDCAIVLRDMAPSRIARNRIQNGHVTLQRMHVALTSNAVTQTTRPGYSFDRVTGVASGNTLNGAAYVIPLSNTPYTARWLG